jgi:hypothetical protein
MSALPPIATEIRDEKGREGTFSRWRVSWRSLSLDEVIAALGSTDPDWAWEVTAMMIDATH